MIHFKDISVCFNGQQVLTNFNLNIKQGEKVVIYGKSGRGKSTLFNLLLGFQSPDSGVIYFNGTELDKKTVWQIRQSVSYVSQDMDFGEGAVIELIENIFSYRANRDLPCDREGVRKHLEYFELPDKILDKDLQDLSGGEKQRVAIIIALLLQREIFLLDEVTSALDKEMKKKVVQLFVENKGWTVLVVSHDATWQKKPNIRTIRLQEES